MHEAALAFVADTVSRRDLDGGDILDLGGRDVNGTTRHLFPRAQLYITVDIEPHPSVDYVCDAGDLNLDDRFDVVVSTECFEHTNRAPDICATAYRHLLPGGTFVATMAGPGREPHSASGGPVGSEFYRNVNTDELGEWLEAAGFEDWTVDVSGTDVRCIAVRGV
jgi:SAM-dependent methyltransferase